MVLGFGVWMTPIVLLLVIGLIYFTVRYYQCEGFQNLLEEGVKFTKSQDVLYQNYEKALLTNQDVNNMTTAIAVPDIYLGMDTIDATILAKRLVTDPTNKYKELNNKFCSGALQPANLPRHDPKSVEGCGWWYMADPSQTSIGVFGTVNGPAITDNLPAGGEWIWNLSKAQELEEIKTCKQITSCELIDTNAVHGRCGFCPTTGYAVPVTSSGVEKYLNNIDATCGGSIIMDGIGCSAILVAANPVVTSDGTKCGTYGTPSPDGKIRLYNNNECDSLNGNWYSNGECLIKGGGSYSAECASLNTPPVSTVCSPNSNGRLTKACLISLLKGLGYGKYGGIMRIVSNSGVMGDNDRIAISYLTNVGVEIPPTILSGGDTGGLSSVGGQIDKNTAANLYMKIKQQIRIGLQKRVRDAANWLVNGLGTFEPCTFDNDAKGPFPLVCLQQLWRMCGCQPAGEGYPRVEADVNQYGSMSWQQITDMFTASRSSANTTNCKDQAANIKKCLGITLKQDVTYSDAGCWSDTWNRALSGPPQQYGYTVESCFQYAKDKGADVFALQHDGWCVINKPGDDYKKYGPINGDCPPLGAGWNNHVYKINKQL